MRRDAQVRVATQRSFILLGAALLLVAAPSCQPADQPTAGMHELTIVGRDYAFEVPETIPAGPTAISFANEGVMQHELALALLVEGVNVDQVLEADDPEEFIEGSSGGILFADPSEVSGGRLLLDLLPGRTYMLACFIQDAEESPPHTALGMVSHLSVN